MSVRDMDIVTSFSNEQSLVDVIFEIGLGENERERVVQDGFDSMRTLVSQYEHDPEGLRTYMKALPPKSKNNGTAIIIW